MEERRPLLSVSIASEEKSNYDTQWRPWKMNLLPCIPARYMMAFASCLGFINVYALRVNLSIAIVQMENSTAIPINGSARSFQWSSFEQGQILAAFFYGYILTQVPGGLLAQKFGGRWVFGIGIVMTAVLTLLTPLAAYVSVWLLVVLRALEGFFEGVTFPAMHVLWSKWAPPKERSRLSTISYAGPHLGTIISFPLSALLVEHGFAGGWPSVFYVFGMVGILWFLLWIIVGYSEPATHPRISNQEKSYIESSIAAEKPAERAPIPWFHIFKSPAFWGIAIAHFCNNWGGYTLLTCIPTFYKQTLHSQIYEKGSIVQNGLYSAIPYVFLFTFTIVSGQVADILRAHCLSTTAVRKMMTSGAFLTGATFLLLCSYFGTTPLIAVSLLSIAVGSQGCAIAGYSINHLDIAPQFSGVLMGITNCVGTLPGFIGPIVAKAIAKEPPAPKGSDVYRHDYTSEWRDVFFITAEVYVSGAILYSVLASGEKQYWADGVKRKSVPINS